MNTFLLLSAWIWVIAVPLVLHAIASANIARKAQAASRILYDSGPCLRLRMQGSLTGKWGKAPLIGKLYLQPVTREYLFYADLTRGFLWDEKWVFSPVFRWRYPFSLFVWRAGIPPPGEEWPDLFLPPAFSRDESALTADRRIGGEDGQQGDCTYGEEQGVVCSHRFTEEAPIPRQVTYFFRDLGKVDLEVTFYALEDTFAWW